MSKQKLEKKQKSLKHKIEGMDFFWLFRKQLDHTVQSAHLTQFVSKNIPHQIMTEIGRVCSDMKLDILTWEASYACWLLTSTLPIPPKSSPLDFSPTATKDMNVSIQMVDYYGNL